MSKTVLLVLAVALASASSNVNVKSDPRKLQMIGVTHITGIFQSIKEDNIQSTRVRRSQPTMNVPQKFHGNYILKEQHGVIVNNGSTRTAVAGFMPERVTVNQDTISSAYGIRNGNMFNGTRCIGHLLIEPKVACCYQTLLSFEQDAAVDTAITKSLPAGPKCFYVGWRTNSIMHVYLSLDGKCKNDLTLDDFMAGEKHIYVKFDG